MSIQNDPGIRKLHFTTPRDGLGTVWPVGPKKVVPGSFTMSIGIYRLIRIVPGRRVASGKKLRQQLKRAPVRVVFGPFRRLAEGRDFRVDYASGVVTMDTRTEK